jgi:hypothetical protein
MSLVDNSKAMEMAAVIGTILRERLQPPEAMRALVIAASEVIINNSPQPDLATMWFADNLKAVVSLHQINAADAAREGK